MAGQTQAVTDNARAKPMLGHHNQGRIICAKGLGAEKHVHAPRHQTLAKGAAPLGFILQQNDWSPVQIGNQARRRVATSQRNVHENNPKIATIP